MRAIFTAFSLASAPPRVKKNLFRSPGVTSARAFPKKGAGFIGHARRDKADFVRLVFDGLDHFGMLVADVLVHELGSHVDIPLPVFIPHVNALGLGDHERIQGGLDAPGMDDVFLVITLGVTLLMGTPS